MKMLYWCGIREGELLALTPEDFDFDKGTVSISKSYQRLNGRDIITDPKTPKSNRVVQMPDFLVEEMKDYMQRLYKIGPKDRIFEITKSYLHREMDRGAATAGVKRIRIHDLRHSHISLLIQLGYSAVAIADRVGHESIEITYHYPGILMLILLNVALQPSANTPMCAPLTECVILEVSALVSSTYSTTISFSQTSCT